MNSDSLKETVVHCARVSRRNMWHCVALPARSRQPDVRLHTARGEEGAVDNNSQIYFTAPASHKIRAEKFTAERVTDRVTDVTFP